NIISFYDSHDEWYWDINGDDWQQPFLAVSGEVIFPAGWVESGVPKAACYTGTFGVAVRLCTVEKTERGYKFATKQPLNPRDTLPIVAASPKGSFTPRTTADKYMKYLPIAIGTVLPPLFIGTWAFRRWRKNGKDLKGRGTIIPEYGPPDG